MVFLRINLSSIAANPACMYYQCVCVQMVVFSGCGTSGRMVSSLAGQMVHIGCSNELGGGV